MDGVWTGIGVGTAMLIINGIVRLVKSRSANRKEESKQTDDNTTRIDVLEIKADETRELCKTTLRMCITIGDGMIQSGVNGDVKRAFCKEKNKALDLLK